MSLIIGFTGEIGAGKGTAANLLINELQPLAPVQKVTFSDPLRQVAEDFGVPQSREFLQELPVLLRKFRTDAITEGVRRRMAKFPARVYVIEGIRWLTDEEFVREDPRNKIIYITAEDTFRWARSKLRAQNAGDKEQTFTEFLERDKAETEKYIGDIGSRADFKIVNDNSIVTLEHEIRQIARTLIEGFDGGERFKHSRK